MGTFAVLLHEETESSANVGKRLEGVFPESDYYKFSDHVYLVTGVHQTSDVMEKLEITEDENAYAAVLSLNGSFAGRSWSNLWGWLREADARR